MQINNAKELRKILSHQIERLVKKEITASEGNATANMTGKILSSIKHQLDYMKRPDKNIEIEFLEN